MLYFRAYAILAVLFVAAVLVVLGLGLFAEQWVGTRFWQTTAVIAGCVLVLWAILWRVARK